MSTHGLLAEFTGISGQLLLTRFGPNFKGKVKAGSKQCQGKVKVRSKQGQGKVNASSMQGKAKIRARSSKVKASLRQGQGMFMARSRRGSGKVKARSRRGQPLIGETNFLGRDQDREIRLMKIHYETETEKKWMLIF